jgi:DNA helicase-2/ATP-dependent DNA helicase PcrA
VIVDEYQDTDLAQHQVLKALKGSANRFFAVGDPDQSIYRFRHTDPKNIKRFADDFSAKTFELAVNYRSPQAIAEAAARLISRNSTNQKEAMKVTSGATGGRIFLKATNTSADEAQFVVGTLWPYFSKNGVKPPDFAILARTRDALGEVIAELQKAKVKYRFVDDLPYEETVETRIIAGSIRYLGGLHCSLSSGLQRTIEAISRQQEASQAQIDSSDTNEYPEG